MTVAGEYYPQFDLVRLAVSIEPLNTEFLISNIYIYIYNKSESHRKHITSPLETVINRLVLCRKGVAVYCENHTKSTDTLWAECRSQWHELSSPVRTLGS
jgi:hypothetical protein